MRTKPKKTRLIFAVSAAALAGCASVAPPAGIPPLASTKWTLIDVRQPPGAEPREVGLNKYKLAFGADGRASLTLDCNRGSGPWTAVLSGPLDGALTMGPIAATQALCADDGLGERLGRDLSGTAPFAIDDGRLTIKTAAATYTFDSID